MKSHDRKKLWGRSGNTCSFPGCGVELAPEERGNKVIGEEAHIKGEKPGTPRYDPQQSDSDEERESYENRILLCPTHHTEIDAYSDKWPVERLLQIKGEHEQQIKTNQQFPELMDNLKRLVQQYDGPEPSAYPAPEMMNNQKEIKVVRIDASIEQGINTQIKVASGQRVRFLARGLISFDSRVNFTTPEGVLCNEYGFPLLVNDPSGNTGYAVLASEAAYRTDGDDLGRAGSLYGWINTYAPEKAFFIGSKREIEVTEDGYLSLAVNDAKGTYGDNDGEFRVDIQVIAEE